MPTSRFVATDQIYPYVPCLSHVHCSFACLNFPNPRPNHLIVPVQIDCDGMQWEMLGCVELSIIRVYPSHMLNVAGISTYMTG